MKKQLASEKHRARASKLCRPSVDAAFAKQLKAPETTIVDESEITKKECEETGFERMIHWMKMNEVENPAKMVAKGAFAKLSAEPMIKAIAAMGNVATNRSAVLNLSAKARHARNPRQAPSALAINA